MRFVLLALFLSLILLLAVTMAMGADKPSLLKNLLTDGNQIDINQIKAIVNNDGEIFYDRANKSAGFFFPKGGIKTAIFSAGLWIAGIDRDGKIRMSVVQNNQSEFQPGQINGVFNTKVNDFSVAANPINAQYRIYKIIKHDSLASTDGSYDSWSSWPVAQGAPWIDVDGNGTYNPRKGDRPEFYGDQQLFWVYNDLNFSGHINTSQTMPIGVEVRVLMWGYDQQGALGNTIFCKIQIINKSDTILNNSYISLFTDIDVGFAKDDFPGCDTTLRMGYVYNGTGDDVGLNGYANLPPAVGVDILQGATQYTGNSKDSAKINKIWKIGFQNLSLSSFSYFGSQTGIDNDPPIGTSKYAKIAYDYMQGRRGWYDTTHIDPITKQPSKFPLSGDPVENTGWLPRNNRPILIPQNTRILLSSGPFTFAPQDTQEIICAYIIAQGKDRLNSISLLKAFDQLVEQAYQLEFKIAGPPPQPGVKFSELANEIILDWSGNDSTENYDFLGNRFQGYNIYQGKTSIGPWQKIATYDIKDGIREIYDWQIDPATGFKYWAPVAFGTDSGIKRNLKITKDIFTNSDLVNGREYFFTVTSYSYNRDSTTIGIKPTMMENFIKPQIIIPHYPQIGSELPTSYESILNHNRVGDDAVKSVVILPTALDGKTYQVTFNGDGLDVTSWNLVEKLSGDALIKNCTNFTGDNNSPIYNGFQVKVIKPPSGVRKDTKIPPGWSYFNKPLNLTTSSTASNITWFKGQGGTIRMDAIDATGLTYPTIMNFINQQSGLSSDSLLKIELRFSNKIVQRAYRYLQNYYIFPPNDPVDPSFVPFMRRRGIGWVYQDYNKYPAPLPDTTFENPQLGPAVPFTVWEVDSTDGDFIPRQLNVAFVENNDSLWSKPDASGFRVFKGRGRIDGKWDPTSALVGGEEYLVIFKSTYSDTPRDEYTNVNLARLSKTDIMYILWLRKAGYDSVKWNEGDILTISPNYPLHTRRIYEFVAKKQTFDDKMLMKNQMNRLKVFPNPYFGYNKAERSNLERFVTFSNLPKEFKIRIFSLAGDLIRTINRNYYESHNSSFEKWDLKNDAGIYIASGIYIAHIEIPGVGEKILKLVIVQPDEGLNIY